MSVGALFVVAFPLYASLLVPLLVGANAEGYGAVFRPMNVSQGRNLLGFSQGF